MYIYLKYVNICSVNTTVPKYSRCLFAAVKGIPHSNGKFFSVFSPSRSGKAAGQMSLCRAAHPGKMKRGFGDQ